MTPRNILTSVGLAAMLLCGQVQGQISSNGAWGIQVGGILVGDVVVDVPTNVCPICQPQTNCASYTCPVCSNAVSQSAITNLVTISVTSTSATIGWQWTSTNYPYAFVWREDRGLLPIAYVTYPATNFTDYSDQSSTTYHYDVDGWYPPAWATATTSNSGPNQISAPYDLTATALASNIVSLSWLDAATNATQYYVQRAIGSTNSFSQYRTVLAPDQNFIDSNCVANTLYYYRIYEYSISSTNLALSPSIGVQTP